MVVIYFYRKYFVTEISSINSTESLLLNHVDNILKVSPTITDFFVTCYIGRKRENYIDVASKIVNITMINPEDLE